MVRQVDKKCVCVCVWEKERDSNKEIYTERDSERCPKRQGEMEM